MKSRCFLLLWLIAFTGCAVQRMETPKPQSLGPIYKLRHQIMFSHGGDIQIFEGYMLRQGNALLVKGFAGPGVDLFTVVRNGAKHRETLHIPALKDKLDMAAIGADIARVYLGGCVSVLPQQEITCDFFGEKMIERYDGQRRLTSRRFPQAHGIGLVIAYKDFVFKNSRFVPAQIALSWGKSNNAMVIKLLSEEIADAVDPAVFAVP